MRDESRMKPCVRTASLLALVTIMAAYVLAHGPAHVAAQEPPNAVAKPAAATAAKEPAAVPKARKKARGRLPTYYAKVVNAKQRTEIYGIQGKYNAEISKLQDQVKVLVTKRDAESEGVLTPDQRSEVNKMRQERSQRRKSRSASSKTPAADRAG